MLRVMIIESCLQGMIEEKVKEEASFQARKEVITANRKHRGNKKQNSPSRQDAADDNATCKSLCVNKCGIFS